MMSRVLLLPWLVFAYPFATIVVVIGVKLFAPDLYDFWVTEDSVFEWLQFVAYALAVVVSALTSRELLKARERLLGLLYVGLTLMLFFVAGEEVSWGQRIFGLENPEFFETYNIQKEITWHNLPAVQRRAHIAYILIGLYGALMWLPVALLRLRRFRVIDGVVPAWYLSSSFLFVALLQTTLAYVVPRAAVAFDIEWLKIGVFFVGRDQELAELFLSLGFLLFVLDGYRKARDWRRHG